MALIETRTLEEAKLDFVNGTVKLTWRERIFKDGVEKEHLRTADSKTYTQATKDELATDNVPTPNKYTTIMGW